MKIYKKKLQSCKFLKGGQSSILGKALSSPTQGKVCLDSGEPIKMEIS